MKVAIYSIAKNEAKQIPAWEASLIDADEVFLLDTGSTDGTDDVAREYDIRVGRAFVTPFRFDDARNTALHMLPTDIDVCIALDLDERLQPGWRDALERAWKVGETTNAFVTFRFSADNVFMQNNRVHSRAGWRWKYPCHEALVPSMAQKNVVEIPDFVIEHHPDMTKPRPNYLEMLAWGDFENPDDMRMLHYYGRELLWSGWPAEAGQKFKRYLELEPQRPFPAEKLQVEALLLEVMRSGKYRPD